MREGKEIEKGEEKDREKERRERERTGRVPKNNFI